MRSHDMTQSILQERKKNDITVCAKTWIIIAVAITVAILGTRMVQAAAGYHFTTLNPPSGATVTSGINNTGQLVGYESNPQSLTTSGFIYDINTNVTTVLDVNTFDTRANGINNLGQAVGQFLNLSVGNNVSFVFSNGTYIIPQGPPNNPTLYIYSRLNGINDHGLAVGDHFDAGTPFVYNIATGTYTDISIPSSENYPAGLNYNAFGINNNGWVIGDYNDAVGCHGVLYNIGTAVAAPLDYPGSVCTFLAGINDSNQIVGWYLDASSHFHGLLYSAGTWTTIDDPANATSVFTVLLGINNQGQIVGFSSSKTLVRYFLATPTDQLPLAVGKDLGNPCDHPGGCTGGTDPISIGTGNLFEHVTDYATAGPNTLSFTRYYNSLAPSISAANTLGVAWRSTYDRSLKLLSPSSVTAERADGRMLNFTLQGSTWTSDSDVDLTLTSTNSTWTLTDRNDTVETYTAISPSAAVLTSITARNGYTQTLTYDASNQLLAVTDSFNRTLSFTYQNGLLRTVTTPDGLVLTYVYDVSGVTPGVVDRLRAVTYPTTPVTRQRYIYTHTTLPFALTGIIDENGSHYAIWTYDDQSRGTSSQLGTGANFNTVVYNDNDGSRTVTNALGQQAVYRFTTLQGVPKLTEIDRLATATTAAATQVFAYDGNGYLASQTDWNGHQTVYVNDSHGQPTSITEAVGTPQERTTVITYHPTLHLPTQVVTPGLTTTFTYDSSSNLLTKTLTDTTATTIPYTTNGTARTWTYTWANFLLTSVTGPRSDVTQLTHFTYDSSGALTGLTNALGQITQITQHLPGGLPQTVIDPNGVTTQLTYDDRLRLLTRTILTGAGPLTTAYAYDPAGNLL